MAGGKRQQQRQEENKADIDAKKGPVLQTLHPNSRKMRQEKRKKERRQDRRARRHSTKKRSHALMELCAWVRMQIIQDEAAHERARTVYTEAEAVALYSRYFDELVAEPAARPGAAVSATRQREGGAVSTTDAMRAKEHEHVRETWRTAGLRLPDLTRPTPVAHLKEWEGDPAHLGADILNDAKAIEFRLFRPSL